MTAPRRILPGATYLVTRRCSQRQFLLRPSAATTEIFLYVLALAARRYGVEVHAFCVMSNHYHLVVTDPDARLPAFGQYLDSLVARAVNASLGRWETFWAPSSYSAVALTSPVDMIEKMAYVLANPVAAGLVRRADEWPGLWSAPGRIGAEPFVARRPKVFFRPTGYLPESVELRLTVPAAVGTAEELRAQLLAAVRDREASRVGAVLGAAKVLAQRPTARPPGAEARRALNPRVAARDRWKRAEVLGRLREFLHAYRKALEAWRGDEPLVPFPAGTYLMRVVHGAPCDACS